MSRTRSEYQSERQQLIEQKRSNSEWINTYRSYQSDISSKMREVRAIMQGIDNRTPAGRAKKQEAYEGIQELEKSRDYYQNFIDGLHDENTKIDFTSR